MDDIGNDNQQQHDRPAGSGALWKTVYTFQRGIEGLVGTGLGEYGQAYVTQTTLNFFIQHPQAARICAPIIGAGLGVSGFFGAKHLADSVAGNRKLPGIVAGTVAGVPVAAIGAYLAAVNPEACGAFLGYLAGKGINYTTREVVYEAMRGAGFQLYDMTGKELPPSGQSTAWNAFLYACYNDVARAFGTTQLAD